MTTSGAWADPTGKSIIIVQVISKRLIASHRQGIRSRQTTVVTFIALTSFSTCFYVIAAGLYFSRIIRAPNYKTVKGWVLTHLAVKGWVFTHLAVKVAKMVSKSRSSHK
jgi:hypothetical protein